MVKEKDERIDAQKEAERYKLLLKGKCFRHFKGNIYRVLDIGVHSETAELMVCYASEHDPAKVWVRPLNMFMSPVDAEKYPNADQKMRFEGVFMDYGIWRRKKDGKAI